MSDERVVVFYKSRREQDHPVYNGPWLNREEVEKYFKNPLLFSRYEDGTNNVYPYIIIDVNDPMFGLFVIKNLDNLSKNATDIWKVRIAIRNLIQVLFEERLNK